MQSLSAVLSRLESADIPAVVIGLIVLAALVGLAIGAGARRAVRNAPDRTQQQRLHGAPAAEHTRPAGGGV